MKINTCTKSNSDVLIDGKSVENVTDFKHLGSYLTADGNINREISARMAMASTAFYKLNNIWKSKRIMKDTKLKLYTSNERSVLLYASETWRTNQTIESKPEVLKGVVVEEFWEFDGSIGLPTRKYLKELAYDQL
ncbi:hypothetical protein ElyMa_003585600 [Elysia marginata]|uniref:DUF6451 domain-containing protein n=1 Tax=Elysia marginata TaxID=1093978 RepID=A0AAV4ENA5_9GAST|nr:hypothetical protein ElyMa_003585600 [Elysia marginata]